MTKHRKEPLRAAQDQALAWPRREPLAGIKAMLAGRSHARHLLAFRLMLRQLRGGQPSIYFDLARPFVDEDSRDCRWQALVVCGEYIATRPGDVWALVAEHGPAQDEDLRTGVATVLLEHLLEHDFERYFPRVASAVRRGATGLAHTLRLCWGLGTEQHRQVALLLREALGATEAAHYWSIHGDGQPLSKKAGRQPAAWKAPGRKAASKKAASKKSTGLEPTDKEARGKKARGPGGLGGRRSPPSLSRRKPNATRSAPRKSTQKRVPS